MIIQEYLKNLISITHGKQKAYYEWMLKNGQYWEGPYATTSADIGIKTGPQIKQCYANSSKVTLLKGNPYFEGYYVTEIEFPIEHAFNTDQKKQIVIDVTSWLGQFKVKDYFGVEVPKDILMEYFKEDAYLTPLQWYYRNYIENEI